MSHREGIVLDGSWERPGRNPLGAGFAGVLLCGALYSALGSLSLSVTVAVATSRDHSWIRSDSFIEIVKGYYDRFQIPILLVTAVAEFAVFFGLTLMLVQRWHSSRPGRYLAYTRPAALDLVLAAVGAATVVPLAELLDSWSYVLFPILRELRSGGASLLAIRSPGQLVLVTGAVAITPAVCEEVLFRGWLQGTLRRRLSAPITILIQGVLFALFHMSPLAIVALAFIGFYLGYLFERCGTLFASMTAHCIYNLTIICFINIDPHWPWLVTKSGDIAPGAVAVSTAVFALTVALIETISRRRAASRA
ncbi:MAG: CPBP family intramembrane glutamic endopeptidase [Spirochaetia bacterium]